MLIKQWPTNNFIYIIYCKLIICLQLRGQGCLTDIHLCNNVKI